MKFYQDHKVGISWGRYDFGMAFLRRKVGETYLFTLNGMGVRK